ALDQIDFPRPVGGIRAKNRCLWNQAGGDSLQTLGIGTALVQHALARGLAQGLPIRLRVHLIDLISREHAGHVLLALHANRTAAGGTDRLATAQQQRRSQATQIEHLAHRAISLNRTPYASSPLTTDLRWQ